MKKEKDDDDDDDVTLTKSTTESTHNHLTNPDLLQTLLGQLGGVVLRHKKFGSETKLDLYVYRSPFYLQLRWEASSAVFLASLNSGDTPLLVIGNANHHCLEGERETLRLRVPSVYDTKFSPREYGGEQRTDQKNYMKSETMMCYWALRTWKPDLLCRTSVVVQINSVLVFSTQPMQMKRGMRWNELFSDSPHLAYMMRENQMNLATPTRNAYHQMFLVAEGESVQFPRPFIECGGPRGSGIVAKMLRGNPVPFGFGDDKNRIYMNHRFYTPESTATVALPCPLMTHSAYTFHHAQGSTIKGKAFMDLGTFSHPQSDRLALPISASMAALLVGSSRTDQAENTRSTNVDKGIEDFYRDEDMQTVYPRHLMKMRKMNETNLAHDYFR